MVNGDISRPPGQPGTLEETVQQMNILIQENRDLKGERFKRPYTGPVSL